MSEDGSALWEPADLYVVGLFNAIGVACIFVAWLWASGELDVNAQIPPLDVAIAGLVCCALGDAFAVVTARRKVLGAERRTQRRLGDTLGVSPRDDAA